MKYLEGAAKSLDAEQRAEFEKQVRSVYDQMVRNSIEPGWARPGSLASAREDDSQREHRVGSGRIERPLAP